MPKGGSRYKTSRPARTREYHASKDKGNGVSSVSDNPLENPEAFSIEPDCKRCGVKLSMSLVKYEKWISISYEDTKEGREVRFCPTCIEIEVAAQELRDQFAKDVGDIHHPSVKRKKYIQWLEKRLIDHQTD